MATTHSLVADTRMEDLPGLANGDTIALGGHVLTCESDLSAKTGLYATGTGTIRLLDGGNCDFSGSNPLPATVTIEGGTEDNPLPAHGDYGYVGRASAVCTLRARSIFAGTIVSHCIGNRSRVQFARVVGSTSSTIILDRAVDWEAGDVIGWGDGSRTDIYRPIVPTSVDSNSLTHASGTTIPAGAICILLTAGFCVGVPNEYFPFSGMLKGDELGFVAGRWDSGTEGSCIGATLSIGRLVAVPGNSGYIVTSRPLIDRLTTGHVGMLCSMAMCIGSGGNSHLYIASGPVDIGNAYAISNGGRPYGSLIATRNSYRISGGILLAGVAPNYGRCEYVDTELPAVLYNTLLTPNDELVVRTTTPPHPTCTVHRVGGIATLVDRTDIEIPTSLPDAWRLDPIEDGTAWHDVPMTVLPGKTLSCIWYWMLGEEGATAGCQILDGEGPGWGSIAMNPGMADVLAETAVPDGASPLRPFVAVPISWRNPGREIRKVVLRGWARGGTAYSRIDPAAGGLA